MLKSVLLLILVAVVCYFIGTINFSKIIAWHAKRKDITKIGSHNPGSMNMLRSFGFWLALLTFVAEVTKAGLVCLSFKLLFNHFEIWGGGEFVYYLAGFFLMIGYNFPVWSKFKGGKGVACFAGIYIFSSIWYIALGWFVICFILFLFIDYGSVISFTYIGGLTIATTVSIWTWLAPASLWVSIYVTAMIWVLYALTIFKHRGNIKRLIAGTENKAGFKGKVKKIFVHKKGEVIIDEEHIDSPPEKEIIIEDNKEE